MSNYKKKKFFNDDFHCGCMIIFTEKKNYFYKNKN